VGQNAGSIEGRLIMESNLVQVNLEKETQYVRIQGKGITLDVSILDNGIYVECSSDVTLYPDNSGGLINCHYVLNDDRHPIDMKNWK
jgi:hypothetical protein